LNHRRLQAHPSTLTKNNTLLASNLPEWLITPVVKRFGEIGIFQHTPHGAPNHVLINEYKSGEGIMPHEDGGAYADVVATVSLGGTLCLDITEKPGQNADSSLDSEEEVGTKAKRSIGRKRILQEPRSLLITTGPAYTDILHGISPIEADENLNSETVANWGLLGNSHAIEEAGGRNSRTTRVSLTYRDVLKVSLAANKVFGALGRR
jgi:alkylated DNA repair protein alkB homolog 6